MSDYEKVLALGKRVLEIFNKNEREKGMRGCSLIIYVGRQEYYAIKSCNNSEFGITNKGQETFYGYELIPVEKTSHFHVAVI